jgi:putative oxidoreductase
MDLGLLLLRITVGGVIAAHGAQKALGWFGGHGLAGTSGWLDSMGFRPGDLHAVLVSLGEFGGGVLLILGLLTPLGAAAVIGVMLVAIGVVHWKNGFFNMEGGFEFNLLLMAAAASIAFMGPGDVSLDGAFGLDLYGFDWGLIAIAIGLISGSLVLATRRARQAEVKEDADRTVGSDRSIDLTDERDAVLPRR